AMHRDHRRQILHNRFPAYPRHCVYGKVQVSEPTKPAYHQPSRCSKTARLTSASTGPPQIDTVEVQVRWPSISRWLRVEMKNGPSPFRKTTGGFKSNSAITAVLR